MHVHNKWRLLVALAWGAAKLQLHGLGVFEGQHKGEQQFALGLGLHGLHLGRRQLVNGLSQLTELERKNKEQDHSRLDVDTGEAGGDAVRIT